jgi:hypothetical protein
MSQIKNITNIFNFKKPETTIQKTCTHYKNNVQIYASCCDKYVDCRLCHNDSTDHKIIYGKIKKTKCTNCSTENDVVTHCKNCNIKFGNYHCKKCLIWCDKFSDKDIYHCDKCKCCRLGKEDDVFHCDNCNLCLLISSIDNHKCHEINQEDDCPICLNKLNNYGESIVLLKCLHTIHDSCLTELIKYTDKTKKIPCCTMCKMSVVNFNKYELLFDNYCRESSMPDYYSKWKNDILCNDCNKRSTIKYHNTYNKCTSCKSYNTTVVNTIKNK